MNKVGTREVVLYCMYGSVWQSIYFKVLHVAVRTGALFSIDTKKPSDTLYGFSNPHLSIVTAVERVFSPLVVLVRRVPFQLLLVTSSFPCTYDWEERGAPCDKGTYFDNHL